MKIKDATNLAALGDGVRLLVLERAHSEVLDRLTRVLLAAEKDGVCARRRAERELVEGENLAAGVEDALLGAAREAEGSDGELGHGLKAGVVCHGAYDNNGLGF